MEVVKPIKDKRKIKAIKDLLRGRNVRDYCLFTMGINCGLRIGDLLGLELWQVLDNSRRIRDRIRLREEKTDKRKDFPINQEMRKALTEYLATRTEFALDEPLFLSRKSRAKPMPLQRLQAHRILAEAARSVGIQENIGTHTLRKTFGYHAYQATKDISLVRELLNHSSERVTRLYIGLAEEEMDEVYLSLNL